MRKSRRKYRITSVNLTERQVAWLRRHRNSSAVVRDLIDKAMAKEARR